MRAVSGWFVQGWKILRGTDEDFLRLAPVLKRHPELHETVVREMVCELPEIREGEIPLRIVSEEGLVFLDPDDGGGYFRQQVGGKLTKNREKRGGVDVRFDKRRETVTLMGMKHVAVGDVGPCGALSIFLVPGGKLAGTGKAYALRET